MTKSKKKGGLTSALGSGLVSQHQCDTLVNLMKSTVAMVCREVLNDDSLLKIEGLLGLTLKGQQVILVNINELAEELSAWTEDLSPSDEDPAEDVQPQIKGEDCFQVESNSYNEEPVEEAVQEFSTESVHQDESGYQDDIQEETDKTMLDPALFDDEYDAGEASKLGETQPKGCETSQLDETQSEGCDTSQLDEAQSEGCDTSQLDERQPGHPEHPVIACGVCKLKFKSVVLLKKHTRPCHVGPQPGSVWCLKCRRSYKSIVTLKAHIRDLHLAPTQKTQDGNTSREIFQCDECQLTFKCKRYLTEHIRKFHKGEADVKHNCSQCDRKFLHMQNLQFHMRDMHGVDVTSPAVQHEEECDDSQVVSDDIRLCCVDCGLVFRSLEDLQKHSYLTHGLTGSETVTCLTCNKDYKGTRSARFHVRDTHTHSQVVNKVLECPVCKKDFKVKRYLTDHIRNAHPEDKDLSCSQCGKHFKYIRNLHSHLRTVHHMITPRKKPGRKRLLDGPAKNTCADCGKVFKASASLRIHMQGHSGMYRFNCEVCGKQFKEKALYEGHMNRHMNKKPFVCSKCGKSFYRSGNLKQHETSCGGNTPKNCPLCKAEFRTVAAFNGHMMKVHGTVVNPEPGFIPWVTDGLDDSKVDEMFVAEQAD